MGINIDGITRTKTTIVGDERMVGRDDLGDFKVTIDDLLESLAGKLPPGMMIEYVADGDPAVNGDRVILQQGQTVLIADYQAAFDKVYKDQTTPAFFKCDVDGTPNAAGLYFIMQDRRGLGIKGIGDADFSGRAKVGPTELSEMQEDQMQGHEHNYFAFNNYGGGHSATTGTWFNVGKTFSITDDGTNGTPRTGLNNRDSVLGTQWGLTY
ncbi:MAG TPA: hypothetical protein PLI62_00385 [Spirochaetota bacterium]|nr:hypothetical protein [Spirochaetota bacterium]